MKSHLTHAQAVEAARQATIATIKEHGDGANDYGVWAEGFIAQLEAIGIEFATPESINKEACKFIFDMSMQWHNSHGKWLSVIEDMKAAGYTIVRSRPNPNESSHS